jgi:hypothetical protein
MGRPTKLWEPKYRISCIIVGSDSESRTKPGGRDAGWVCLSLESAKTTPAATAATNTNADASRQYNFLREVVDFGVSSGFSIPGIVVISSRRWVSPNQSSKILTLMSVFCLTPKKKLGEF